VDRITTGTPAGDARAALDVRLGYRDALATVAEPYALWAVEGDPALLREALPIDAASGAAVFAPSIAFYRERKVRLLNGAHTALAPLAVLAGVPTVREAAEHPVFGPYLARVLFGEIVPATSIPAEEAEAFARTVVDRFRNPHLRHEWRTIATNQTAKVRLRVVPSVVRHAAAGRGAPPALVLALAGYLRYLRPAPDARAAGRGRWRGATYEVDDADAGLVARHWLAAERGARAETVEEGTLRLVADLAVRDAALWGAPLGDVLGLPAALAEWLVVLERDGVEGALRRATEAGAPGEPRERPAAAVGAG
jgi:tagaturonate reductase